MSASVRLDSMEQIVKIKSTLVLEILATMEALVKLWKWVDSVVIVPKV